MESQHPPVRTGGIYIQFNSRVNCGEHPCYLSGLELVKWFPMLVLIFFAWCSRGNTKQETGEDNLEEAKYRTEILNFKNILTSSNICIQFPHPTNSHLPAPSSTLVKVMGIRFALDNCHKENVILFHHPLFSWCRCFSFICMPVLHDPGVCEL